MHIPFDFFCGSITHGSVARSHTAQRRNGEDFVMPSGTPCDSADDISQEANLGGSCVHPLLHSASVCDGFELG